MSYKISISLMMVFILFAFTVACEKDHKDLEKSDVDEFKLGKSQNLNFQEEVKLEGTELHINFHELVQDSRCPSDVVCVHAGQVEITVVVRDHDLISTLNLTLDGEQSEKASAVFSDYKFTLLKVLPLPNSQITVPQDDYRIVLQVDKI